jgi:NAD(P)-dependent dehydrogenase (short-subunit alcohol dehydrogenase family)
VTPTPRPLPDLSGTTALVTGASGGLGLETARGLARAGARVLLACRSPERGERAAAGLRAADPGADLGLVDLDLASLAAVRAAAERVLGSCDRLDLLVNNAGVMALPRLETADGFEMQLGVNHLGHFALTGLLLPRLLAAPAARIVTVSSLLHRQGAFRPDDPHSRGSYGRWKAYAQSKLANLLFTFELQRRLATAGARTIAVACHPGYADTPLQTSAAEAEGARLTARFMGLAGRLLGQSAAAGSLPALFAATSPDVRGGDFIGPSGLFQLRGAPRKVAPHPKALDADAARALWGFSEAATGVEYELDLGRLRSTFSVGSIGERGPSGKRRER